MKLPEKQFMNNCKVFRELFRNRIPWNKETWIETGEGKDKSASVCVMIEIADDAPDGIEEEPFSFTDAVICDAVYTIFKAGVPKFTLSDLFKVMVSSNSARLSSSEQRALELRGAVERLSFTDVVIDYTKQAEARGFKPDADIEHPWVIGGFMLPIEEDERSGAFWFRENELLPLYRYAEELRQIISVDSLLLSPADYVRANVDVELQEELLASVKFRNDKEMILLKRYLLHQVAIIRNGNNKYVNRRIVYYDEGNPNNGLLPRIGIKKADYAQEKPFEPTRGNVRFPRPGWENRVRQIDTRVRAILSAYAYGGYIGGYDEVRSDGRGLVRGVDVIPQAYSNDAEIWKLQQEDARKARQSR